MVLARGEYTVSTLFDGENLYRAYADSADGSLRFSETDSDRLYLGTYVGRTKPTKPSQYKWTLVRGAQGIPGKNGTDGTTTYTWIRYADTPTSGMDDSPLGKKYIGLAFNQTTQTESDSFDDYQWSLMPQNIEIGGRNLLKNSGREVSAVGGREFVQFADLAPIFEEHGLDEVYSLSLDLKSADISNSSLIQVYMQNGSGTKYNFVADKVNVTEDYQRFKFEGLTPRLVDTKETRANLAFFGTYDTGNHPIVRNVKLEKGNVATDWTPAPEDTQSEIDDTKEQVRKTVKTITEEYYQSTNPDTTVGGSWTETAPTWDGSKFMFVRSKITYVDGTTDYTPEINLSGAKGDTGPQGPQGPRGPQGIQGPSGSNGQSQWVHIRYSANPTGSGMEPSPSSTTKYVGIAVTNSATAPAYTGFTWSKYVGEDGSNGAQGPQGLPGQKGADGTTTYTWIRYADTPTSGMSQYPDDKKYIGLAFNKTTQTESSNYSDYKWSLMPQNIDIGVRNLILDSGIPVESSAYMVAEYFISEDFVEGQEYIVTIKGTKSSAVNFGLWQNVGSHGRGSFKHVKDDLYQLTFTSVATVAGSERRIRIYQPPSGSADKATIEWIKMVKGDYSSLDWTEAPEDIQSQIDDKASAGDLDETVKTIETESRKIASLRTDVDITKNNMLITHTDEYVNKITTTESKASDLEGRVVKVEETKENVDTFFQFDEAFTIGKSNAQTKLRMTNDEIQFLDGETKGTYITGNTMVSQNITIQDKLNLTKHTMETEGDVTVIRFTG